MKRDAQFRVSRPSLKLVVQIAVSAVVLFVAVAFCFHPGVVTLRVATDPELRSAGRPRLLRQWFEETAGRYNRWATRYLASQRAHAVSELDVAGTEWPIFGSVFLLLTAEELFPGGKADVSLSPDAAAAVKMAARVIADPATGSWTKRRWGDSYLKRENVFYRMLLLMGFSTYERLTGDRQYHVVMTDQMRSLAEELKQAPFHLRDDYPGECYPNDVLWAVAALQRAGRLEGVNHDTLTTDTLSVMTGPLRTPQYLPAFQANQRTAAILQGARGCNNSGIIIMAAELDKKIARRWYEAHVRHFWDGGKWIVGFRELPRDDDRPFADVDSGPVAFGLGSVASAFGIGAARVVGRFDHAAPLIMESVACSWPTPFGLLVPGFFGYLSADGWCLGETALLFSLSRPAPADIAVPFTGPVPRMVWAAVAAYWLAGSLLVLRQVVFWTRWARNHKQVRPNDVPPSPTDNSTTRPA